MIYQLMLLMKMDGYGEISEVMLIKIPKEDSEVVKDIKLPGPQRPVPYFAP